MEENEFYVEELLCKDAAKIVIDEDFKHDLKNRIMFGDKYNNITELPKQKNNFKRNKYLKIASGFVICVFVSGTIFNAIDVPSRDVFTKGEGKSKVVMPIVMPKDSIAVSSEETDVPQPKNDIVKSDTGTSQPSVAKGSEGTTTITDKPSNSILEESGGKSVAVIDKDSNKGNSADSDADINKSIANSGKSNSSSAGVNVPIEVPTMDDVKVNTGELLKCYDSRYSLDEKSLVSVKDGGIYVKDISSSIETKLISYNDKTQIVDKPNFTLNDGIVYYKADKVTLENGASGEKNGAIYLTDKDGQESTKLVDGKSPMISKDGKKLVYEVNGKINILTLATNEKRFVDTGKYPAFSENGNLISYIKEEVETQNYDVGDVKKDVSIEKNFSSLLVFDLVTENTCSLTNKEVNINNTRIEAWAETVRSGNVTSNFDVTSKYSYFESIWSSNNKEIYIIRKNNSAQVFELIKFSLDK
ncbi:MAG: hypothetical protein ACI8WT_004662 [Clostridium sp.]